jgi:hypothetical protein
LRRWPGCSLAGGDALPSARTEILDCGGDSSATIGAGVTSSSSYCRFMINPASSNTAGIMCSRPANHIGKQTCQTTLLNPAGRPVCWRSHQSDIGGSLGILRNMFVAPVQSGDAVGAKRYRFRARTMALARTGNNQPLLKSVCGFAPLRGLLHPRHFDSPAGLSLTLTSGVSVAAGSTPDAPARPKTWNVAKLTSEISSSPSVIS